MKQKVLRHTIDKPYKLKLWSDRYWAKQARLEMSRREEEARDRARIRELSDKLDREERDRLRAQFLHDQELLRRMNAKNEQDRKDEEKARDDRDKERKRQDDIDKEKRSYFRQ